ncbi:MAG TPA: hypothetical protein VES38_04855 [Methylotenera sp.]|nr:hypothetical protein [Methylotenera sp.]
MDKLSTELEKALPGVAGDRRYGLMHGWKACSLVVKVALRWEDA